AMDASSPHRAAFVFDHPEDLVPVFRHLFQPLALTLERRRESTAEPRCDLHVLEPGDHHLGLLDAGWSQLELAALDHWSVHDASTNPGRRVWFSFGRPSNDLSPLPLFYRPRPVSPLIL